jgi:hypothetical protein
MSGVTLDDVILDASTSNIAISDGTDTLAINGDGSINAVVTATDLDIRALVDSTDSVAIGDGAGVLLDILTEDAAAAGGEEGIMPLGIRQDAAGSPVSADGDYHPMVFNNDGELKVAADLTSSVADDAADSGNPIKVGGRAFDGVLTAISASNDRYDLLGDMYRRTWVNTSANIGLNTEAVSVTTTVTEFVATPLPGRRFITIQNTESSNSVYLVESGATPVTQGLEIPKKSSATFEFGEDINIFLGTVAGTGAVRIMEAA